jgi:hypothetical protein
MFELNFRDERYLPFEYLGAVSRWRIELPRENNYFDLDTVTDLVLHLNYTGREGGDLLRRAANHVAQQNLPGEGWIFLDLKHDFPDAWELFRNNREDRERCRDLGLRLRRNMFPFIPDHRELWIDKIALMFAVPRKREHTCEVEQCPCPEPKVRDCHDVVFIKRERCEDEYAETIVPCVATRDWPDLYCGVLDARMGPIGRDDEWAEAKIRFQGEIDAVPYVYMFCRYAVAQ